LIKLVAAHLAVKDVASKPMVTTNKSQRIFVVVFKKREIYILISNQKINSNLICEYAQSQKDAVYVNLAKLNHLKINDAFPKLFIG
jgi:hypothetical protein